MTDHLKIGADDPDLGREVADAYEGHSVVEAAPGAAWLGRMLGVSLFACGIAACWCVCLGLLWVAVRIAESL